jgi:hypothetical protein
MNVIGVFNRNHVIVVMHDGSSMVGDTTAAGTSVFEHTARVRSGLGDRSSTSRHRAHRGMCRGREGDPLVAHVGTDRGRTRTGRVVGVYIGQRLLNSVPGHQLGDRDNTD